MQLEGAVSRLWNRAVDLNAADAVAGTEIERDFAQRNAVLGQRTQGIAEARLIKRKAIDGDRDGAVVVPEAFKDGPQAIDIASGARNETEGVHGRRGAQYLQLR